MSIFNFFNEKKREKELMKKYNVCSSSFSVSNNTKEKVQQFTVFCVSNMQKYTVKATEPGAAIAKLIDKTGFSAKSLIIQR